MKPRSPENGHFRFSIADCRLKSQIGNRKSEIAGPRQAFTLIELLVVMSIIAVLAAILLPAISAVGKAARVAAAESLIRRLDVAVNAYEKDQGCFPPDYIPVGPKYYSFVLGADNKVTDWACTTAALPPETLHNYLCNPFLDWWQAKPICPYIQIQKEVETRDLSLNGLAEIVDPWGRPVLYSRGPFMGPVNFNYAEPPSGLHRPGFFDLYSVGPDGQTGWTGPPPVNKTDLPDPGLNIPGKDLATFVQRAMDDDNDGTSADDISNFKRQ